MASVDSDRKSNEPVLLNSMKIQRTVTSMIEDMTPTDEEKIYREECIKNSNAPEDYIKHLKCTKCSQNFQPIINRGKVDIHPLLSVLMCENCCNYYGDGDFSLDSDGEDKYCRWCGEGGTLLFCSKCVCGFCAICIKKHFGEDGLEKVQNDDDWVCYFCNPKPLWYLRFICSWAEKEAIIQKQKLSSNKKGSKRKPKKKKGHYDENLTSNSIEDNISKRRKKKLTKVVYKECMSSSSEEEKSQKKSKNMKTRKSTEESSGSETKNLRKRQKIDKSEEKENDSDFERKRTCAVEKLRGIWKLTEIMSDVGLDSSKERLKMLTKPNLFQTTESLQKECEKLKSFTSMMSSLLSTISSSVPSVDLDGTLDSVRDEEMYIQREVIKLKNLLKKTLEDSDEEARTENNHVTESSEDEEEEKTTMVRSERDESEKTKSSDNSEKEDKILLRQTESESENKTDELISKEVIETKEEKSEIAKPVLKVKDFAKMTDENAYKNPKGNITIEISEDEESLKSNNCEVVELEVQVNSIKDGENISVSKDPCALENTVAENEDGDAEKQNVVPGSDSSDDGDIKNKIKRSKKQAKKIKDSFENFRKKREKYLESKKCEENDKKCHSDSSCDGEKSRKSKRVSRRILISSDEDDKVSEGSYKKKISVEEEKGNSTNSEDDGTLRKVSSGTTSSEEIDGKKSKWKRIKRNKGEKERKPESESASENEDKNKRGRKNIKKILKKEALHVETKEAIKNEEERKKRMEERKKLFEELFPEDIAGKGVSRDAILDFDPVTKEPLVTIHKKLLKKLKPHQVQGVKFMWDNLFESVKRLEEDSGSGCILAHCMGLGKTLQVVTFIHSIMSHDIGVTTVLVVCPVNTVVNWMNEFEMWLGKINTEPITLYDLLKFKKPEERSYRLNDWHKNGGVMIISYDLFRNLTSDTVLKRKKKSKKSQKVYVECLLDPGPDVVVCDEGHLLKNEDSTLSKCMNKVKTSRRVVLTGTPLQNNLLEYHCMVQFVKPNILGTKKEFANRFVNPIVNGQFEDSTEYDVKVMKRRSYVLHSMLTGCVQRFDYSVITPYLPKKYEYVLSISLTETQAKMYKHFITQLSAKARGNSKTASLFNDYHNLQRIWTHPRTMLMHSVKESEKEAEETDSEGSLKDFVVDTDEEETTPSSSSSEGNVKTKTPARKRVLRSNANDPNDEVIEEDENHVKHWWEDEFGKDEYEDVRSSNKLVVLFWLLKQFESRKDKVLVFSQSLYSLDLIEHFLKKIDESNEEDDQLCGYRDSWVMGLDYFRLDGTTSSDTRALYCKNFNKESNTRARLFLISTRAGGLGINLCAANRVIMFDASWNPSHDVQSIFRVYRFGQTKTCYIYRFLAEATMEEKIYRRQVTKLSLALRVVDEHQIERHYSMINLQELYEFEPTPPEARKVPMLPKDEVLAELLNAHKDIIVTYHEHDSLLQNQEEEELSEEERKAAWKDYQEERAQKATYASNDQMAALLAMQFQQNPGVAFPYLQSGNNWFGQGAMPVEVIQRGLQVGITPVFNESSESFFNRVVNREQWLKMGLGPRET